MECQSERESDPSGRAPAAALPAPLGQIWLRRQIRTERLRRQIRTDKAQEADQDR